MKGSFINHVMLNCWFVMVVECTVSSELFPDHPKLKRLGDHIYEMKRRNHHWDHYPTFFSKGDNGSTMFNAPYKGHNTHLAFDDPFGSTG